MSEKGTMWVGILIARARWDDIRVRINHTCQITLCWVGMANKGFFLPFRKHGKNKASSHQKWIQGTLLWKWWVLFTGASITIKATAPHPQMDLNSMYHCFGRRSLACLCMGSPYCRWHNLSWLHSDWQSPKSKHKLQLPTQTRLLIGAF